MRWESYTCTYGAAVNIGCIYSYNSIPVQCSIDLHINLWGVAIINIHNYALCRVPGQAQIAGCQTQRTIGLLLDH